MKIPNPYFENVLKYGDLHMEQILVEYDYPLLSVLVDDKNNRYVSICYSVINAQRWVIAPISVSNLIGLLTNKITLDAPYKKCNTNVILAVRNYKTKKEAFQEINPEKIPEECLPEAGEYLDAEEDEWSSYIRQLQQLRQKTPDWELAFQPDPIIIDSKLMRYAFRVNSTKKAKGWNDLKTSVPSYGRETIFLIGSYRLSMV